MESALRLDLSPILDRLDVFEYQLGQLQYALSRLTDERRLVDVKTAARRLGLHPCSVRRAVERGELQAERVGRRLLIALPATVR